VSGANDVTGGVSSVRELPPPRASRHHKCEHRRCGGTVCNDIAQFTNTRSPRFYRDTPTHPRDLAAYTARVMHRVKRI
jgi:hypothetical protein